jgi:hypothetical protein
VGEGDRVGRAPAGRPEEVEENEESFQLGKNLPHPDSFRYSENRPGCGRVITYSEVIAELSLRLDYFCRVGVILAGAAMTIYFLMRAYR